MELEKRLSYDIRYIDDRALIRIALGILYEVYQFIDEANIGQLTDSWLYIKWPCGITR